MFKIKEITESDSGSFQSSEVYISTLHRNRDRIRAFAAIIAQASGTLISASLVVLFFQISANEERSIGFSELIQLASSAFMCAALIFSLFSAFITESKPSATYAQKINNELNLFRRERRTAATALVLLVLGIFLFVASLLFFATNTSVELFT